MLKQQEVNSLKELLTNWRTRNEVRANPADKILHDLLFELISLFEDAQSEAPAPLQTPPPIMATNDDPPIGGNNPEAPNIP